MPFDKELLFDNFYENPVREAWRKIRYVVNHAADVVFYNWFDHESESLAEDVSADAD